MSRVRPRENVTRHYELAFPKPETMPFLLGNLYEAAQLLGDLRFSQDLYSTGKGNASFTPRDISRDSVRGAFKELESKLRSMHIKWEYCQPPRSQQSQHIEQKPAKPAASVPQEIERYHYMLSCRENIVVPVALGNVAADVHSSGIGSMSTSEYTAGRAPEIFFKPYNQDSQAAKKFEQLLSRSGFDWKHSAKYKPEKVPGS